MHFSTSFFLLLKKKLLENGSLYQWAQQINRTISVENKQDKIKMHWLLNLVKSTRCQ